MTTLVSAYFPPINYYSAVANNKVVIIEQHENFVKQTTRNRCEIITANGKLALSIPLINEGNKTPIKDKKISYTENWQIKHWRALESAYSNSPFFEYFKEDIFFFYSTRFENLFEYNLQQLICLNKLFRVDTIVQLSESYLPSSQLALPAIEYPAYYQVFSSKFGFTPNLSILDLLFNEGPKGLKLLKN
jgi:hypothetical protein